MKRLISILSLVGVSLSSQAIGLSGPSISANPNGQTSGAQTNQVILINTNAVNYIRMAGITSKPYVDDLIGFWSTLQVGGIDTILVAGYICNTNYNLTATNSLLGRSAKVTSPIYTDYGARFPTGSIVISNIPSSNSGCLVVTYRGPKQNNPLSGSVSTQDQRWMAGITSQDGRFGLDISRNEAGSYTMLTCYSNTSSTSLPNGMLWSDLWFGSANWGDVAYHGCVGERNVYSVNFSNQLADVWVNGCKGFVNFSPNITNAPLAYPVAFSNQLNLSIGSCVATNLVTGNVAITSIGTALLFSRPLTPTEQDCVFQALRWLEPSDANNIAIGDSRTQDVQTFATTNLVYGWFYYMYSSKKYAAETMWKNYALGGSCFYDVISGSNKLNAEAVFPYRPASAGGCGKVNHLNIYFEVGVNTTRTNTVAGLNKVIAEWNTIMTSVFPPYCEITQLEPWKVSLDFTLANGLICNTNIELFNVSAFSDYGGIDLGTNTFPNRSMVKNVVRLNGLFSFADMATNGVYSDSAGLHWGGHYGSEKNYRIANSVMSSDSSEVTVNAAINFTNYFVYTNQAAR